MRTLIGPSLSCPPLNRSFLESSRPRSINTLCCLRLLISMRLFNLSQEPGKLSSHLVKITSISRNHWLPKFWLTQTTPSWRRWCTFTRCSLSSLLKWTRPPEPRTSQRSSSMVPLLLPSASSFTVETKEKPNSARDSLSTEDSRFQNQSLKPNSLWVTLLISLALLALLL